jgi:hypothetical protein
MKTTLWLSAFILSFGLFLSKLKPTKIAAAPVEKVAVLPTRKGLRVPEELNVVPPKAPSIRRKPWPSKPTNYRNNDKKKRRSTR